MLFRLVDGTPCFEVFRLLNLELLHFFEAAVNKDDFDRQLFTVGAIGDACWANGNTLDKFQKLFEDLGNADGDTKQQLFLAMQNNQDLEVFFGNPQRGLLDFLNGDCRNSLKELSSHLYSATKDLVPIVAAAGGVNINSHFSEYRSSAINGNVCKACGMEKLAVIRAGIPEQRQWRSDYDHQLCKSKYPIFAVHPYNLIPLCSVCNQYAKKAKDLFKSRDGNSRLAFYPYTEEARGFVNIEISNLSDPEPATKVIWSTQDAIALEKLETWDEVYEIRSRVEAELCSIENIIIDEIDPIDEAHLLSRIQDEARPIAEETFKRKEWVFWYQKLFAALELVELAPFAAKLGFMQEQGADGGDFILSGG